MSFHQELLTAVAPLWQRKLAHPFLTAVADGSIADATFKTWIAQDYLFVEGSVPFLGLLTAKAPVALRPALGGAITAFNTELGLFEQQMAAHEVTRTREYSPTCHAYLQFLLATAYDRPFDIGFTVLYAAEKAYFDAWERVRTTQTDDSKWQAFINNWTSDAFRDYVDWLAGTLDTLAADAAPAMRAEMHTYFRYTTLYEYRFWEMAYTAETWDSPLLPARTTNTGA